MNAENGRLASFDRPSSLKPMFVGALAGLIVIMLGLLIPSPYVIEKPGPVVNTLGNISIGGQEQSVLLFDGQAPTSDATLNLLTVSIVGSPDDRLGWLEVIPALFDRTQELVKLTQVFQPGETSDDRDQANQAMMENSQMTATAAAHLVLDEPFDVQVNVVNIVEGSAADELIMIDDRIIAINGMTVTGMSMVREHVSRTTQGNEVTLTVLRDGQNIDVPLIPTWNETTQTSMVGIVMNADYEFVHDVHFDVDRIGGPSAGMMFALAMVEELGSEHLVGNTVVSGTGTVDDAGNVGAIGGLPQKMWAADGAGTELFLMPLANCASLPTSLPGDMSIVPVETLEEAVNAITNHNNGVENQGISRCKTEVAQLAPVG